MSNTVTIKNGISQGSIQYNGVDQMIITANGISIPPNTLTSIVPVGTIIDFSGNMAPTGFIACTTSATTLSRSTYSALFAAIGTTWGIGDGVNTFGIPFFPVGYAAAHNTASIGTQTVGAVISHTHTTAPASNGSGGGADPNQRLLSNGAGAFATGATGGTANMPAASYVYKCIKY